MAKYTQSMLPDLDAAEAAIELARESQDGDIFTVAFYIDSAIRSLVAAGQRIIYE